MPTWPHANNRYFHMCQPQTNGRINDRCGTLIKFPSFVAKCLTAAADGTVNRAELLVAI